jgi:hypothetical protein
MLDNGRWVVDASRFRCRCCQAESWNCVCFGGCLTDAEGVVRMVWCTPADHGRPDTEGG